MATGQMTTCKQVDNQKEIIEKFYFAETPEWHQKIHENGGTASENVEDSLRTISKESIMFRIDVNGELGAMFTKHIDEYGNNTMECFHVAINFRTKEFLETFWKLVKKEFRSIFWAGLYEQNIQAVQHFKRQGFQIVNTLGSGTTRIFVFKINH